MNPVIRLSSIFVAAWLLLPSGASAAQPDQVAVRELANGLRVVVKPDRRAPVVVSMVWYRIGSVDEQNGVTGVAHVLEHMMFKGTRTVAPGEFSRLIAAAGGRDNAFTSRDYTGYFQTLHKSALPLSFRLEADRMANLVLSPDEFAKELKVVMEERRLRTDDRPHAMVYERLMATALAAHPYRNPVIGWMSDLEHLSVADTRVFYDEWYGPNNATVVVVGDVVPTEVFALAEQYFGAIPRKTLPPRKPQEEPPQLGLKRLTVKVPAELPYVLMAYRVPGLKKPAEDWEPYALDMLGSILSGNDAARLPRTLVKTDLVATSAGASYDGLGRGPAFFYLSGTPVAGRSAEQMEQNLRREVKRVVDEGVTEAELNRVKAQVIAAQVFQRDSMFFQARQIGSMETIGFSYRDLDLYIEKLKQVTADQVREVTRKYLIDDVLTVAYLDPQPLEGAPRRAAPAGVRHGE
ncbi:MAG: insulinase family protein [Burkholderiales bacterium]|jgi:zinc protease|nr:insulinase family protein [Burkholderiales bacterium]